MGRPRLPLGTPGEPGYTALEGRWRARVQFRDWDGVTRPIARYGKTKTAARNALHEAIAERQRLGPQVRQGITVEQLAEQWTNRLHASDRAVQTKQQYEKMCRAYVIPKMGAYSVAEVDVPVADMILGQILAERGYSVAKTCRTVMSGMFGLAVRQRAVRANPIRDVEALTGQTKTPRSLTGEEMVELTDALRASERAVYYDIPDLVDFMLGTGCRIGEALAARADTLTLALDGEAGTWHVDGTVVRVKGVGLVIQQGTKSKAGDRLLALPPYVARMLHRRGEELRLENLQRTVFGSPSAKTIRDPSNCAGDLREVLAHLQCPDCDDTGTTPDGPCAGAGPWKWVTFHTFRKTVATMLFDAGRSAKEGADQLGQAKVSLFLDVYQGRKVANPTAAEVLDR